MHFSTSLLSTSAVLLIAAHSALAFDDLRMLCAVNRIRTEHGLPCLGYSSRLTHAAQGHCEYQAKRRQMTHNGSHGSDPAQRITDSGYNWQSVAENVAYGYQDQSECLDEWMQSPGHRANILSEDATHLGSAVGYSSDGTPYYTQDFGGDGHRHDFPECPSSYDDEDNGYSGGNDDYSSGRDRDSGYSDNDDSYGSGRGGDDYTWSPDNYGSGRGNDYSSGRGNDDYGSGNGYGSNNGYAPSSNGRDYYGSGYGSAPSSNGRDSYGSGNGYGSNNGYAPSSNGRDYYGSGRGGYGPSSNGRDNYGSGRGDYGSGRGDYGSGNRRDTSRGRRPRSYGDVDDYNTGKDYGRGRSPSRASGRGYGGDRDRHGRRGGRDRSCSTDRRGGRGGDRDGHRRRGGY